MRRLASSLAALIGAVLLVSACSGAAVLNAITTRADYRVERGLRYDGGARGTFDLYVPDGADATTPTVVFVYGGNWDSGTKEMYLFVGQSLASAGFIVAIPDYRIYPEATFPAFVEDGARAAAAVARTVGTGRSGVPAGAHPLFLMGHSAGAQIAALLALDERYLAAEGLSTRAVAGLVGLSGPYDFLPLEEDRYRRIFPAPVRDRSQPVNFAGPNAPPALLISGLADTTVDPENTRSLAARLRAAGAAVTTRLYPGVDHVGTISAFATALPLGNGDIPEQVAGFIRDNS